MTTRSAMFPRGPRGPGGSGGSGGPRSARGPGGPRGASLRGVPSNLLSLIMDPHPR